MRRILLICVNILFFFTFRAEANIWIKTAFLPGSDALEEVVISIKKARTSIDLGLFYLTHDAIIDALCYKASRGIKVTLLLDSTMGNETYKEDMQKLIRAGCNIYLDEIPNRGKLHAKFAVIDKNKVITGTANWTKFGFDGSNFEDIIFIKNEKVGRQYLKALEKIKKHCESYPYKKKERKQREKFRFPIEKDYVISNNIKARNKTRDVRTFNLENKPTVYFSPHFLNQNKKNPFQEIIKSINTAEKEIDITMYAISDPLVIDSVIRAVHRGVKTRIIADEWMMSGGMRDVLQRFFDAGAKVYYYHKLHGSMHLKSMIIDDKVVWRGSGNWTGSAGNKNFEDFVKIESERLAKFYDKVFNQIFLLSSAFIGKKEEIEISEMLPEDKKYFKWQTLGKFKVGVPPAKIRKTRKDFDVFSTELSNETIEIEGTAHYLNDEQYHPMLIHLIQNAQQSIIICMYLAAYRENSNQPYLEKIIKELGKASKRGIYVYIVFEVSGNPDSGYEAHHTPLVKRLRKMGIDAKLDVPTVGMHDKALIVDLSKIIIGSHNWSEGALSGKKVQEGSVYIACHRQYKEFADYITSHKVLFNMSKPTFWKSEIANLRRLQGMKSKKRKQELKKLPEIEESLRNN